MFRGDRHLLVSDCCESLIKTSSLRPGYCSRGFWSDSRFASPSGPHVPLHSCPGHTEDFLLTTKRAFTSRQLLLPTTPRGRTGGTWSRGNHAQVLGGAWSCSVHRIELCLGLCAFGNEHLAPAATRLTCASCTSHPWWSWWGLGAQGGYL